MHRDNLAFRVQNVQFWISLVIQSVAGLSDRHLSPPGKPSGSFDEDRGQRQDIASLAEGFDILPETISTRQAGT